MQADPDLVGLLRCNPEPVIKPVQENSVVNGIECCRKVVQCYDFAIIN